MPLPAHERNWVFTANGQSSVNQRFDTFNTVYSYYTDYYARMMALVRLKDTLKGFAPGPWTVMQSRNGNGLWSSAGVDHWVDMLSFWDNTNPDNPQYFSYAPWIILQNTFAGRTAQILINVSTPLSAIVGSAWVTTTDLFAASAGGAVPAVPASANKLCDGIWGGAIPLLDGATGTWRLHVQQTWDAGGQGVESLRFVAYQGGSLRLFGCWDKLTDVPQGGIAWPYPEVTYWAASNYGPSWNNFSNFDQRQWSAVHGTTRVKPACATISNPVRHGPVCFTDNSRRNTLSGGHLTLPMTMYGNAAPLTGKLGRLVDFRLTGDWGPSGAGEPGTAPLWVRHWNAVWPWDPAAGPMQIV